MGNTNLMYALSANPNIGTMRENFFYNQVVYSAHSVILSKKGDFTIDDQYLFEIGESNKGFRQIRNEPNSFLALDNIEMGDGKRIPL